MGISQTNPIEAQIDFSVRLTIVIEALCANSFSLSYRTKKKKKKKKRADLSFVGKPTCDACPDTGKTVRAANVSAMICS